MLEALKSYEAKMSKSIDSVAADFAAVRAGRANASVLDRIMVDYYGSPTPIQQIAAISSPDPRILVITPWDGSALKGIEKAIQNSDLGINPQNDGRCIRLSFPQLTGSAVRNWSSRSVSTAKAVRWRSAISAATLWMPSRRWKRTLRSPRTTVSRPRRTSRS